MVITQYKLLRLVALQQRLNQVLCLVQALEQVCFRSLSQTKLLLEVYLAHQQLDSTLEVAHHLSFLDRRMVLNLQVQFLEQCLLGRQDHYFPQHPSLVVCLEIWAGPRFLDKLLGKQVFLLIQETSSGSQLTHRENKRVKMVKKTKFKRIKKRLFTPRQIR